MKYKLSMKNENGKWWIYGNFEKNQYDNLQASFKIENLEKAIEIAKGQGKSWIIFSAFEDDKKSNYKKHDEQKQNGYEPDLDDEVPFS